MTQTVKIIRIVFVLLALPVALACVPDCRQACTAISDCFGDAAGDPDLCTSRCAAEAYAAKNDDLACTASATCTELKNGACAPDCTQLCQAGCVTLPDDCTARCKALTVAQRDCLHKNTCDLWQSTCASSLTALTKP